MSISRIKNKSWRVLESAHFIKVQKNVTYRQNIQIAKIASLKKTCLENNKSIFFIRRDYIQV